MGIDRPVVAYCRVSTLEQKRRGYGIDIQVRDVQAFAERQGLLVARFYRDEAESGIKEDRKQLRRLLRDCRAGRVGSVILPSLDRLSRDVRIAENLFHEFEQLSIDVLIADMPTYNGRDRKDVRYGSITSRADRDELRRGHKKRKKGCTGPLLRIAGISASSYDEAEDHTPALLGLEPSRPVVRGIPYTGDLCGASGEQSGCQNRPQQTREKTL